MPTVSRLFRNIPVLLIMVLVSRTGWSAPPDDPSEMLARAEALYYEAEFAKSVELLSRANEMLPYPSIGEDILSKMKTCVPFGCIQMESLPALTRLKSRVDPQFSPQVISRLVGLPLTVHGKARIDVNGTVVSGEIRGGDLILYSAIRTAVDQWKFLPALTGSGARCIDTEIPITLHLAN